MYGGGEGLIPLLLTVDVNICLDFLAVMGYNRNCEPNKLFPIHCFYQSMLSKQQKEELKVEMTKSKNSECIKQA